MKNKAINKPARKKASVARQDMDISYGLITLAYIVIPTFAPNLMAFDTNAPKFLALSLVNLAGFITLLANRQNTQHPAQMAVFFKTPVGLVYSGFLVFSLLSFFNSINLTESVLQLSKIFTVFTAVFILFTIFMQNLRFLNWIIIIFTGLLIIDAISVFYHISEFVRGNIDSITEIVTIYSNKNVLASAIFVKLPFALWLMLNREKWLRYIGWFGLMTGITATFFMATRTFYLGLLLLTVLFLAYMLLRFFRDKRKTHLQMAGAYLLALGLAYLAFTGTQEYLYPKSKAGSGRLVQGVGEQIATINTVDESARVRLNEWAYGGKLLLEKPLLGIGAGNFKVAVLKYENKGKEDFSYMYKAHNDFIETFAEIGFIGGLLYLGLFILIAWKFLQLVFLRYPEEDDLFKYYFMAFLGMSFYAVDAFFNFPSDRPEIQVLFIFYLSTGIAVIQQMKTATAAVPDRVSLPTTGQRYLWLAVAGVLILMAMSTWVLMLNFRSSKTMRTVYEEVQSGTLRTSSAKIIAGFPVLPNLTILGEPISVQKARYLLNENKSREAIRILHADQASPWDGRKEYFLSMGYNQLENIDSALFYSEALYKMKPLHIKNLLLICQMLESQKKFNRVEEYLESYLETSKQNGSVWTFSSGFYDRQGNLDKSWELIEEANKYMPYDTLVEKQHKYIYHKKFIQPYRAQYNEARVFFDTKEYSKALDRIDKYLAVVPDDFFGQQLKAFTLYYLKRYEESIRVIDHAVSLSKDTGAIISLRGVCYRALNNMEAACKDFETAMKLGNADGKTNYERLCLNRSGN